MPSLVANPEGLVRTGRIDPSHFGPVEMFNVPNPPSEVISVEDNDHNAQLEVHLKRSREQLKMLPESTLGILRRLHKIEL